MHPLIKNYRAVKAHKRTYDNEGYDHRTTFWGMLGDHIPWVTWGYIIGSCIGLFIVVYYVVWPILDFMCFQPFIKIYYDVFGGPY